ncbi:metalloprotease TldD [Pseudohoeflea coraliihabitans]|uniref:Metalloprotease TldD n=1 Tax=Pseudohoeflea coraliihabitans TaxID=2860393 RepID=A0ABS6WLU9_9HYPH|nr:metalloprotease TldD [Pseudohoeflea sp. DP4N28-3]MBW3096941.1 metalloprotease TldD [Pseudohoeflea sp. DP4N28-3]
MTRDLLSEFDIDTARVDRLVGDALKGSEDGELYCEFSETESLLFDNGRLKSGAYATDRGFGLRAVAGETTGFAHSGEFSEAALKRAADAVSAVARGGGGTYSPPPQRTNRLLYTEANPIGTPGFEDKVALLQRVDAYLRDKDERVRQVTASLAASWQVVEILRADGHRVRDIRPLTRINFNVMVGEGDRQESGSFGMGGRKLFGDFLTEESWREGADEALRQALVNLSAIDAPAGAMDVVLGAGWPGVMLHEAVGHGLEGDANRKKTSAFAGLMGERVASKGVTVVDDGTIADRRGSLSVDDEGTPSGYNVLIEDGILVNYMQDRQNARLMGMKPTGNGRRQSYAHQPMPRMTNTYMLSGEASKDEMIAAVKKGIYAVSFGGGQVDTTSGKFVFGCTEAYMIEDGKIGAPVKGAMLIGNGPEAMQRIAMVGNDMALDPGIGMCGKAGQSVPVGVGQPHVLMNAITVGGTRV